MGSKREVMVLQNNLEVGRGNARALVLHGHLSLGPRELSCEPGKEEASQHPARLCGLWVTASRQ